MPPQRNQGMRKPKDAKKTLKRILGYLSAYKWKLIVVACFVVLSSGAGVAGNYFLKPIIDDFVTPWIGHQNPDLSGLVKILILLGIIYAIGAFSTYIYNRIMVNVAADSLYKMRKDMFSHMQKLPIKYFDTRTHGEIMSRYTNDIDTLRNMMSQSMPQLISSAITVVGVFLMMLILSLPLTILVIVMLFIISYVIKLVGGKSAIYYRNQQKAIGAVNGYVEEMVEGQKVVKVFCHEEESKKNFNGINEELCNAATKANTFASILMPITNNLSYIHYALTAAAGAAMAIMTDQREMGIFALGLGALVSFLQYTRSFSRPITQLSQQFNVILNALAGAERIFSLLDEEPETDDGYVTLVNATIDENGNIKETEHRTGIWAWKHPHHDGTLTYTQVRGEVEFKDVVFGYESNKI
ncbi:MAG: ABC transporter ATP-binding protein, partial [Clostridia bacterium]|nr:ABC transporter ATP-binding protein [Clostridia bacterium]